MPPCTWLSSEVAPSTWESGCPASRLRRAPHRALAPDLARACRASLGGPLEGDFAGTSDGLVTRPNLSPSFTIHRTVLISRCFFASARCRTPVSFQPILAFAKKIIAAGFPTSARSIRTLATFRFASAIPLPTSLLSRPPSCKSSSVQSAAQAISSIGSPSPASSRTVSTWLCGTSAAGKVVGRGSSLSGCSSR